MKTIVLTDAGAKDWYELVKVLGENSTVFFDTLCKKGDRFEYSVFDLFREEFLDDPKNEFALVRYSGDIEVSRLIGDECSEMIVILDYNKQSPNYIKKPVEVLRDVVRMTKNS